MDARRIPKIQTFITSLNFEDTRKLAHDMLRLGSLKAIEERLKAHSG
jgi:phosphoenolpyruvate-protein kinase (PTS system EI component)